MKKYQGPTLHQNGFTLIELLVVIAIIGILASVVLASLSSAREKGKIANAVAQIREMRTASALYINDTGFYPAVCDLLCTAGTDPYITNPGIPGWNGPYFPGGVWNLKHPWGGHFTINQGFVTGGPELEMYFFLDEDAPNTSYDNNTGVIPTSALQKIDQLVDDGNLSTGYARGDGNGFGAAVGEMVIVFQP